MYSFKFWKTWPPVYTRLWWILVSMLAIAIIGTILSLIQQPGPVFTWERLQDLQRQEIPIYNVEVSGITLPAQTENYIVFERWLGNPMEINPLFLDMYFFLFTGALVILLAIISVLPRFWFLAASAAAVFMITSFQIDSLEILGLVNKIPTIVTLFVLLGLGLYFQFVNKGVSLAMRALVFSIATVSLGVTIFCLSNEHQPLRHLAIHTLPSAIVLIVLFIILVSHEIIAGFVTITSNGAQHSKSLRHFLIISVVYLLNLWLTFLDRINYIEWSYTISPILLLLISGTLALWGIRQRESQYSHVFPADPFAVYLIGSLAVISFSTIGYFIASSNDLVILSLKDIILYAHIGYGMIFLLYVIANFLPMIKANYKVNRVLYKPTAMPYFSYRLAGLIFTLAILFYNNWISPVNHFISGYNTALGDLFVFEDDPELATAFYKKAQFLAPYNQHAAMALAQLDPAMQNSYLKGANSYHATEFTLLAAANNKSSYLDQLIALQDAHTILPASGIITNSLGLGYSRMGMIDSAYKYFSEAQKTSSIAPAAKMNLLGLLAKSSFRVTDDSLKDLATKSETPVQSNAFAIANRQGTIIDAPVDLPKDSLLNLFSASLVGNYITNHINNADTAFIARSIAIAHRKENKPYAEFILVPASKALYASGEVNKAFEISQELVFNAENKDLYNTTMALWALDQGKADVSMSYLRYVMVNRIPQTSIVNAVAVAEAGRINEAIIAWDTLQSSQDSLVKRTAESMVRVLAGLPAWYSTFTDREKYLFLKYRVGIEDSLQFSAMLNQITNDDIKAKAILDRSKLLFDRDELSSSAIVYNKLQGLHLTDMDLFSKIKYFELRLFASRNYFSYVEEQINKGVLFGPYRQTESNYYQALRAVASKDSVKAAKHFLWIAHNNYYFDEGIVAAAGFFHKGNGNNEKSYSILSEALQVNPNSVKILKAYIIVARSNGYGVYASSALQMLHNVIGPSALNKFIAQNQLSDLLSQ